MFHHFHDEHNHPKSQGSITADKLEQVLLFLKKEKRILSPEQFRDGLLTNNNYDQDICLTFDDGIKSQIEISLPVLRALDLSAFFFIYSGIFGIKPDNLEFYRDFRHNFFDSIEDFYSSFFSTTFDTDSKYKNKLDKNYSEDYLSSATFYSENDRKFRFLRDQVLTREEYNMLMDQMLDYYNYNREARKDVLFMNKNDLIHLREEGHSVGLHSKSHPTNMERLKYNEQYQEFSENKQCLEEITNSKVWSMSHPSGSYSEETLSILKELSISIGFRADVEKYRDHSNLECPRIDHTILINKYL